MSGNLYFVMMTSQVVVTFPQGRFVLVIDKYAIKQMLNIEYFKLKHRAKVPCQTGSAINRHANTRLYDFACTKNIEKKGSMIK